MKHIPLDRLRAAIGRRMVESKQQVPHFYVTHEYDVDAVMALRKQINALLPEDAETYRSTILSSRRSRLRLRQFPNLNASLTGNEIIRHGHVNIGVAVAVEGGLLTVVCRDADRKPLRVISSEVNEMVARASGQGDDRRYRRLDLLDQQPGHVRCRTFYRHHQSA